MKLYVKEMPKSCAECPCGVGKDEGGEMKTDLEANDNTQLTLNSGIYKSIIGKLICKFSRDESGKIKITSDKITKIVITKNNIIIHASKHFYPVKLRENDVHIGIADDWVNSCDYYIFDNLTAAEQALQRYREEKC